MKNLVLVLGVLMLFGCSIERQNERREKMGNTISVESIVYETQTYERVEVLEVEGVKIALWHNYNGYGSDMEVLERVDDVVVTDRIPHTKFYEHSCGQEPPSEDYYQDNPNASQPISTPMEGEMIEEKPRFKSDIWVNELPGDRERKGGMDEYK